MHGVASKPAVSNALMGLPKSGRDVAFINGVPRNKKSVSLWMVKLDH
jgi:hypothetical protein